MDYYDEDIMINLLDALLPELGDSYQETTEEATENVLLFVKNALRREQWKAVRLAIRKNFHLFLVTRCKDRYSALGDVCCAKDAPVDIVHALINKDSVNTCNWDDYCGTPLHSAANNRRGDIIRALIRSGAHTDAMDDFDNVPLKYYCDGSIKNLDPELFMLLMPNEPVQIPFLYMHIINGLCRYRAIDYDIVCGILEHLLLNMMTSEVISVAYKQHSQSANLWHDNSTDVIVNIGNASKIFSCRTLEALWVLSLAITMSGLITKTTADPLLLVNLSTDATKQLRLEIDSLWVKCRQKQANPLSFVECCCRITKMSIFPANKEKVTRLCLPP